MSSPSHTHDVCIAYDVCITSHIRPLAGSCDVMQIRELPDTNSEKLLFSKPALTNATQQSSPHTPHTNTTPTHGSSLTAHTMPRSPKSSSPRWSMPTLFSSGFSNKQISTRRRLAITTPKESSVNEGETIVYCLDCEFFYSTLLSHAQLNCCGHAHMKLIPVYTPLVARKCINNGFRGELV